MATPSDRPSELAPVEAITAFVEHYRLSASPSRPRVVRPASPHSPRRVNGVPISEMNATTERAFAAVGRWFPPPLPHGSSGPEGWQRYQSSPALADLAARYPRRRTSADGPLKIEDMRDAIAEVYDALDAGERLTAERYRAIAQMRGLPSMQTLAAVAKKSGSSFSELARQETLRRIRRRQSVSTQGRRLPPETPALSDVQQYGELPLEP